MKRHDELRNLHEALFALDKEIRVAIKGLEQRLNGLSKYKDTFERIVTQIEFERKNDMYGRRSVYDFDRIRNSLINDASNIIYEAIHLMGDEEFIKRKQNVIFAFWFMGQFDVYALELQNKS